MILKICATLTFGLVILLLPNLAQTQQAFRFIALGDMPYGASDEVFGPYKSLIAIINRKAPDFTVHLGDIKDGTTPCSDAALREQLAFLNSIEGPVLYTPGDNEWTDCHRQKAGAHNPLERLSFIRKMFFANSRQSLGRSPIAIERQADVMTRYADYVENVRLTKAGVQIITAHVVGSNNNFETRDLDAASEFFSRDKANVAWIENSFDKAIANDAKAIILLIHADMFEFSFIARKERFLRHSGYRNFGEAVVDSARAFARPVLLVFGDGHQFSISRPFARRAPNIVALEVYGAQAMHAVEIAVNPDDPAVFSISQVFNPASPQ